MKTTAALTAMGFRGSLVADAMAKEGEVKIQSKKERKKENKEGRKGCATNRCVVQSRLETNV